MKKYITLKEAMQKKRIRAEQMWRLIEKEGKWVPLFDKNHKLLRFDEIRERVNSVAEKLRKEHGPLEVGGYAGSLFMSSLMEFFLIHTDDLERLCTPGTPFSTARFSLAEQRDWEHRFLPYPPPSSGSEEKPCVRISTEPWAAKTHSKIRDEMRAEGSSEAAIACVLYKCGADKTKIGRLLHKKRGMEESTYKKHGDKLLKEAERLNIQAD
ncbi:MAG: hypothetical protein FWC28_06730 [Proteobacteria bacterium]|nr:hypothetical protein [Cystobacterineae bacterium]MCL2258674.1 hypothetical protein [Cystobacterineae bacterium]MCL2314926.1 hypothetical protein [Pseudomonadota bacterium]